ncbi:hypothetical protein Tco_0983342 [Tanacetum coccineum]
MANWAPLGEFGGGVGLVGTPLELAGLGAGEGGRSWGVSGAGGGDLGGVSSLKHWYSRGWGLSIWISPPTGSGYSKLDRGGGGVRGRVVGWLRHGVPLSSGATATGVLGLTFGSFEVGGLGPGDTFRPDRLNIGLWGLASSTIWASNSRFYIGGRSVAGGLKEIDIIGGSGASCHYMSHGVWLRGAGLGFVSFLWRFRTL